MKIETKRFKLHQNKTKKIKNENQIICKQNVMHPQFKVSKLKCVPFIISKCKTGEKRRI